MRRASARVVERLADRFPQLHDRLGAADLGLPTARGIARRTMVLGTVVLVVVGVGGSVSVDSRSSHWHGCAAALPSL